MIGYLKIWSQNITMGLCVSCFISEDKLLDSIKNSDTKIKSFSFDGYYTIGKVVHVYDGDSVHFVIPSIGTGELIKIKTRLYGIDTPEMRIAEQKESAIKSKNYLIEMLNNTDNIVHVTCGKFDKYGRVLVTLNSDKYTKTINQNLIDNGFAYEYFGDTKKVFSLK